MAGKNQEQQHPQEKSDRELVDKLLKVKGQPGDRDLADLARLLIRYRGFPGAREIQEDLKEVLDMGWGMTEEQLFEKTRQIHAKGKIYRGGDSDSVEDWI